MLGLVVRSATVVDCDEVARLASNLFKEIGHDLTVAAARTVVNVLITGRARYYALLAYAPDVRRSVGLLTLSESSATYAGGYFGIIQEFYVEPEQRSRGIGHRLLENARRLAADRGWQRLEVTAPFSSRFNRSVEFYRKNGFDDSGPRLFVRLSKLP